jgi:hypothetical protein
MDSRDQPNTDRKEMDTTNLKRYASGSEIQDTASLDLNVDSVITCLRKRLTPLSRKMKPRWLNLR